MNRGSEGGFISQDPNRAKRDLKRRLKGSSPDSRYGKRGPDSADEIAARAERLAEGAKEERVAIEEARQKLESAALRAAGRKMEQEEAARKEQEAADLADARARAFEQNNPKPKRVAAPPRRARRAGREDLAA